MTFGLTPTPAPTPEVSLPPPGTQFQGDGDDLGPQTPAYVDFVGTGVQATYDPDTGTVNVSIDPGVGEAPLQIQEDDVDVGPPDTATLNFEGTGVTVVDDDDGKRTVMVSTSLSGSAPLIDVAKDDVVEAESVTRLNVDAVDDEVLVYPGSGGKVNIDFRSSALVLIQTGWTIFPNTFPYRGSFSPSDWEAVTAVGLAGGGAYTDWGTLPVEDLPQWDDTDLWFTAPDALIGRPIAVFVSFLCATTGVFSVPNLVSMRAVDRLTSGGLDDTTHRPVCMQNFTSFGQSSDFEFSMNGLWIPEAGRVLQLQILNNASSATTVVVNDVYTSFRPLSLGEGRSV